MADKTFFLNTESSVVASDRILYTASTFARSSLIHLQEIGKLEAKRSHTSERSGLQSFLFFIVESGSGILVYDGKRYELQKDMCVFINCLRPHSHTTYAEDLWSLFWCHFYGPSLPSVYDKYCERGGRPVFIPKGETGQYMMEILSVLMNIARSSDYIRDMKINEQLSKLITLIMSESWHPEDRTFTPKRACVIKVKEYLDENYAEKITLDDLSSMFFIDKFYLTKNFKNQFGLPISTYIQNIRITKAKQLLRFSDKTMEEIGREVGIDNPAYFSRVFRNIEGISPSTYKEQW